MSDYKGPFRVSGTGHIISADGVVLEPAEIRDLLNRDQVSGELRVGRWAFNTDRDWAVYAPNGFVLATCETEALAQNYATEAARALYTHPTARVTESMVERACNVLGVGTDYTTVEINAAGVRAALTAALGAGEE